MEFNQEQEQEKGRLRELAAQIARAQAMVEELVTERDELIVNLLLANAGTGSQIGALAGVTQPRTAQIKAAVMAKREAAAALVEVQREQRRQRRAERRAARGVAVVVAA